MKNFIFLSLFFTATVAIGQDRGNIYSILKDEDNSMVEYAAVILRSIMDSTIVKTGLSEEGGKIALLNVPFGDYFIEVSFIGYEDYYSDVFSLDTKEYNFPTIILKTGSFDLTEVTVTSRRRLIERKIDKTIVNVDASPMASGGSALDVLDISPGISVGGDGNISLAGRNGVLIFIDNKRVYLSGSDLTSFLESLSAEELAQIEIMTNPPASFDASGNAGVINIQTKKSRLKGYNGNVSLNYGQGRYASVGISTNFNYRNSKTNFYGNFNFDHQEGFNEVLQTRNVRDFNTQELQAIITQTIDLTYAFNAFTPKIGIDHSLNDKTTISLGAGLSSYLDNSTNETISALKTPNGMVEQTVLGSDLAVQPWDRVNLNLDFKRTFDSTDHVLFFDVNYIRYNDAEDHDLTNSFYDGDVSMGEQALRIDLSKYSYPENFKIYSAKLDYNKPIFNRQNTFDLGVKSSLVEMDIFSDFYDLEVNSWVRNNDLSNHFKYSEETHAAYANVNFSLNSKWSAQTGIRMEHNTAKGRLLIRDSSFVNRNLQWFPSLYLGFEINENNNLGLSYGRRILRPNYSDINPYRQYINEFTYEEGNNNLRPQISDNIELNYLGLQGQLMATAYYNRVNGVIIPVIGQDELNKEIFTRPENLAQKDLYGVSLNTDFELADFMNTSVYINLYNSKVSGNISTASFAIEATTFHTMVVNTFYLKNDWSLAAMGRYTTNSVEGTYIRKPFGEVSAFIEKKILNNNGSLKLLFTDIFNIKESLAISNFQNIDIDRRFKEQTQTIRFTFSYRFKKGVTSQKDNQKPSSETETERID